VNIVFECFSEDPDWKRISIFQFSHGAGYGCRHIVLLCMSLLDNQQITVTIAKMMNEENHLGGKM
jgi:hypothetical protein